MVIEPNSVSSIFMTPPSLKGPVGKVCARTRFLGRAGAVSGAEVPLERPAGRAEGHQGRGPLHRAVRPAAGTVLAVQGARGCACRSVGGTRGLIDWIKKVQEWPPSPARSGTALGYIIGTYDKDAGPNNQCLYLSGARVARR
jgi:hypothetical protein